MKSLTVAALFGYAAAITEVESKFLGYITSFGKSYSTLEEYELRLRYFTYNENTINNENSLGKPYKLGHNQFSDWTNDEYLAMLTYQDIEDDSTPYVSTNTTGEVY